MGMRIDPANTQAIGEFVYARRNSPNAILGTVDMPGIGKVTLFSDPAARDAFGTHVKPGLGATGEFVAPLTVPDLDTEGKAIEATINVPVVWGQRLR